MPAEPADATAPTAFRAWAALLGGMFIAGVGLYFLIIGHGFPVLSAAQLAVGCWMAVDGGRGLLRRHQEGSRTGGSGTGGPRG